ncbi:mechanosensitive ion channel domain-containing protein [Luteimonas deserti]|uniref:Small-conductance mechanosensitive channel n=1 Tax=Luteimonas deserti TaxID=2752306 RepID=A0A7Z0QUY0_9GAMM|nr:mechanosensitive ion channel domain-containing protein [Luteimonas deserti]NYZ64275.1 mechanosensitive ion channel [Luteimonas deserti]
MFELGNVHWNQLLVLWGPTLLKAAAVLLVGLWLSRRLTAMVPPALSRFGFDPMLGNFLRNVAYIAAVVIVVVAALGTLGVQTAPLLAVIGTAGLAIGLALKDSLSNIAAGVMLVTLRPFKVGDVITAAGQTGTVREVRIFQSVIEGPDKQLHTIPNNLITTSVITNLTIQGIRRVELVIGIGYGDDIDLARKVALDQVRSDPRVLEEPGADVVVYELGDNAVNLGIRCFVKASDWFGTKTTLLERIKTAFDAARINIPYPQRDTHLYLYDGDGQRASLSAAPRTAPAASNDAAA